MKILKTILVASAASLLLISCRNEEILDTFKGADFSFVGVAEMLDDKSVEWSSSAKVSVLDGVSNVLYQPLSSGEQPKFTSRTGIDDNAMEIYAVWPYSEKNELVYGGLKAYLKPVHDVSEEIEGLQVAYASDIEQEEILHFRNAVSYLRLTLTKKHGITSVMLAGLGDEVLAGLAELTLAEDGTPSVNQVTMVSDRVSLVSDDVLEGTYLIPVLPVTLENGCVLEFLNAEGYQSKVEKTGKLDLVRNSIVDFGPVPEELTWQKAPKARIYGITSNEIVVSWSGTLWSDPAEDFAGRYSIGIYADADCTSAVEQQEWNMEGMEAPEELSQLAYVFSGLTPSTDYWVKVTDLVTNASADVVAVTTMDAQQSAEVAEEGEYVVYDSFPYMVNGGDIVSGIYGKDASGICAPDVIEPVSELAGWTFEGMASSHPGYVGLSGDWSLLSGEFSSLKETATVIVSFSATGTGVVDAYVVDATNRFADSVTIEGDGWNTYSIELLNVSPTSKLLLECHDCTLYLDNVSALVDKYEVVSNAPSVEAGHFFWSDGFIIWRSRLGNPDGYNIYVDDVKINDEIIPNTTTQWHLTGLSCGEEHTVVVAAVMGSREDKAEPVKVITGAITQNVTNVSPRSLSVAIENRAGGPAKTESPALYVELYKDSEETPLFSSIVVDGLATIEGQSFVTSLALSSAKDQRPTNVTFGRLEPATTYKFRVKSYAEYAFTSIIKDNDPKELKVLSPHGESEWSEFVSFTTEKEHEAESGEVLFHGFDGCCINQDFINKAPGTVPHFRAGGVKVGTLSYSSLYSWGADNWAFYPLRMAHPSSQFAQYAWITGIGGNQTYPCTTGSNSTATAPAFLKGATAYKCNANASPDLTDWYISNSAWPYQGYIGLGTDYTAADKTTDAKLAFVITEVLENNLSDTETLCTLTFKGLAMFGRAISVNIAKLSPDGTWSEPVSVPLVNSAGTTDAVEVWPVDDNHKWHEHTCQISLKKGDRVGIATNKGGHALIDDIQIKIK